MKKSIFLFAVICFFSFQSNISYAQSPNWLWAVSAGGISNDMAESVAVDAAGNIYVTGYFTSPTITFGSETLTNPGYYGMFLVKYDANGSVLWAKGANGGVYNYAESVATDASGNLFVAGNFDGSTISLGANTLTNLGIRNVFIAKYDTSGNVLWAKSASGGTFHNVESVTVDVYGNSYLAGWFQGPTVSFDSITLTNSVTGENDIFLVKYDADGNVRWAKSAGGSDGDAAYSVVANAFGDIYLAGSFRSDTITFGSNTLINSGYCPIFITKYDTSGNVLWAKPFGGISCDIIGESVAADDSGNTYVTGNFYGSTTLGSDTLINSGSLDVFVAKFDSSGNAMWARYGGGTDGDVGLSVAADTAGNVFISGCYSYTSVVFGTDTLTCAGYNDLFLAKYNNNGNMLWVKSAGGPNDDVATSVAVDVLGNPFLAGYFCSPSITFGSYALTNTGDYPSAEIFLTKSTSDFFTGIGELFNSSGILIVPNPATGEIAIKTSIKSTPAQLSIMNMNGQVLLTRQITEPKTQFDISSFPSGVYFVRLIGERTVELGKFIKQ